MRNLTRIEYQCLTAQEKQKVQESTFKIIQEYAKKLKPKDNLYTKRCLSVLKEDLVKKKNVKENIYKVFELKENVKRLIKESVEQKSIIKAKKNIANIVVTTAGEGDRDLETIYVDFDFIITPHGKNKAGVRNELERIAINNSRLGNRILSVLERFSEFDGTGTYSGHLRATPVSPGTSVKARNEISINTNFTLDSEMTFEDYVSLISKAFDIIDANIIKWLKVDEFSDDEEDETEVEVSDNTEVEDDEETDDLPDDDEYYKSEKEFEEPSDEDVEKNILKKLKGEKSDDNEITLEELNNLDKVIEESTEEDESEISEEEYDELKGLFNQLHSNLINVTNAYRREQKLIEDKTSPYLTSKEDFKDLKEQILEIINVLEN